MDESGEEQEEYPSENDEKHENDTGLFDDFPEPHLQIKLGKMKQHEVILLQSLVFWPSEIKIQIVIMTSSQNQTIPELPLLHPLQLRKTEI
ncbi:hypothetical protein RRG08_011626 [Elysia crispata]|uniref:Uncharacterized protein n=1 Tax=Elysia crispata TaxID=231223 RepID=A0AAE0Y1J8_9GAST|nr:hypothetical protein RRG08_011626 [Elysia crispata]